MASEDLVRARRKLVAIERAKFRLHQRLEAIDFELDVVQPAVQALDEQSVRGELPDFGTEVE